MEEENNFKYDVSIIIPCYQEESHLEESVEQLYALMNTTRYIFEVIFVDDCSRDKTRDIILSLSKSFPDIQYLFHQTNTGRGGAFLDGLAIAGGKYVGFLDIDLEVSHVYLTNIILCLEEGYDVATVYRNYNLTLSPIFILRHILSVGYKILVRKYLGMPRMDTETGFKFFRRDCIDVLSKQIENKKWFFDTEVMVLAYVNNYKIKEIDGLFIRKPEKVSTVNLWSDTLDYFIEIYKLKKRLKRKHIP